MLNHDMRVGLAEISSEPDSSAQRETLPALMQEVQTFSRLGVPETTA